jgi:hypothetical protein
MNTDEQQTPGEQPDPNPSRAALKEETYATGKRATSAEAAGR